MSYEVAQTLGAGHQCVLADAVAEVVHAPELVMGLGVTLLGRPPERVEILLYLS